MFHAFGFGVLGLGLAGVFTAAFLKVAFPLFVIWMIVDGVLRTDAEYPGTNPNRKVLWVIAMVILPPVAIAYLIWWFLSGKAGSGPCGSEGGVRNWR